MIQRGDGEMVGPKPLTGNEIQTVMDRLTFSSSRNNSSILTEKRQHIFVWALLVSNFIKSLHL